jgi:glycosyltransferase involved in cell wall biosynthesis
MTLRPWAARSPEQLEQLVHRIASGALDATPGRRLATTLLDAPDTGEPDLVSVIIPAWGALDATRLRACVRSLVAQRDARLEIILAEQGHGEPLHATLADELGVRHVFERVPPPPVPGPDRLSPGRVRNAGVAASNGRFVYFSDGDILYIDPHYFAKLLGVASKHPDLVLIWPRQKHLALEAQEHACRSFDAKGRFDPGEIELLDDHTMRWIGPGADGPDAVPPRFRETTLGNMRVVARQEALDKYHGAGGAMRGYEPSFWLSLRGDGATLARRRHIDIVGGVSEAFLAWGCEDSDFQWKLATLFHVVSLAEFPHLATLHLEHQRSWFDREIWQRNEFLQQQRRDHGVLDAIASDVLAGQSPLHDRLRNTWKLSVTP